MLYGLFRGIRSSGPGASVSRMLFSEDRRHEKRYSGVRFQVQGLDAVESERMATELAQGGVDRLR